MSQTQASPAWASTAIGDLLCGRCQDATVRASTKVASYLSVPSPGASSGVIALLSEEAVRLPIGVVLANGELPEAGSTVRIGNGSLVAEGHTWRPVRWWDPRPHVSAEALVENGGRLLTLIEQEPSACFGLILRDAFALADALTNGDAGPALAVIGLGPGLTPAADDVIAGALAVLALCERLEGQLTSLINACSATRTTALSAALMTAASRGQVIPQAASVMAVLSGDGPSDRLSSAAAHLFGVGATSGHDLCAGMAGALVALDRAPTPAHAVKSP